MYSYFWHFGMNINGAILFIRKGWCYFPRAHWWILSTVFLLIVLKFYLLESALYTGTTLCHRSRSLYLEDWEIGVESLLSISISYQLTVVTRVLAPLHDQILQRLVMVHDRATVARSQNIHIYKKGNMACTDTLSPFRKKCRPTVVSLANPSYITPPLPRTSRKSGSNPNIVLKPPSCSNTSIVNKYVLNYI